MTAIPSRPLLVLFTVSFRNSDSAFSAFSKPLLSSYVSSGLLNICLRFQAPLDSPTVTVCTFLLEPLLLPCGSVTPALSEADTQNLHKLLTPFFLFMFLLSHTPAILLAEGLNPSSLLLLRCFMLAKLPPPDYHKCCPVAAGLFLSDIVPWFCPSILQGSYLS